MDASKLKKKNNSEIEFHKEIPWEKEKKVNALLLFKENTCFLKTEDAKINPKISNLKIKTSSTKLSAIG